MQLGVGGVLWRLWRGHWGSMGPATLNAWHWVGLDMRARLDACCDVLLDLQDRALLSTAYDTGVRALELVET